MFSYLGTIDTPGLTSTTPALSMATHRSRMRAMDVVSGVGEACVRVCVRVCVCVCV